MDAKGLTPILNVSNILESFAWFEKLGWRKDVDAIYAHCLAQRSNIQKRQLRLPHSKPSPCSR